MRYLLLLGLAACDAPRHAPHDTTAIVPPGVTARCRDGTESHAKHHSGACSHHGGVATWYSTQDTTDVAH